MNNIMTTTILRVERRLDENPANALVVYCKKPKLENEEDPTHSVSVFSATVDEKDNNLEFIKSHEENIINSDVNNSEDDSNDENNWRNQYPDTNDSIHEDDMINAVKTINIDNELSTDDEDNNCSTESFFYPKNDDDPCSSNESHNETNSYSYSDLELYD